MKTLLFIVSLILLSLIVNGCPAQLTAPEVPFSSLVSEPERYNGKTVTTEGIYIHGWEWSLLAESITFSGSGDYRHLEPVGQAIWFAGGMPKEVHDRLYQHSSLGAGTEYFGKVKVIGRFDYGGQYGHMSASKYQFTFSEVELLDWVPPE
jgi:hypothetical protein